MPLLLGKGPARFDYRTLRFARYLQGVQPPVATDYAVKVPRWDALGNTQYGDCGFASAAHQVQCWTANETTEVSPDATEVVKEYLAYNRGQDIGVVLLDMLKFWRATGIIGHKILGFAQLSLRNHTELQNATYLFGGASLGVQLPLAYQNAGRLWDVPASPTGTWAPGSWGGHAVPVVAYSGKGPVVVSWGMLIQMSWNAYDVYCDEAFAVVSGDWASGNKPAPNGFDLVALINDLPQVGDVVSPPDPVSPVNPVPVNPVPPGPGPNPPAPHHWAWHYPAQPGDKIGIDWPNDLLS